MFVYNSKKPWIIDGDIWWYAVLRIQLYDYNPYGLIVKLNLAFRIPSYSNIIYHVCLLRSSMFLKTKIVWRISLESLSWFNTTFEIFIWNLQQSIYAFFKHRTERTIYSHSWHIKYHIIHILSLFSFTLCWIIQ